MGNKVVGFTCWILTLTVLLVSLTSSAALITCQFRNDFCGWTPTAMGGHWKRFSGSAINGIRPPLTPLAGLFFPPLTWYPGWSSFAYVLSTQESYAYLESEELKLNTATELTFRVVQMRSEFSSSNNMAELVVVPSDGSAQTILWSLKNSQSQFSWSNPPVHVALHPNMGLFKLRLRFKVGSLGSTAGVSSIVLVNESGLYNLYLAFMSQPVKYGASLFNLAVLESVATSTLQSTVLSTEPVSYLPTPTTTARAVDRNVSCPFNTPVIFQCIHGLISISEYDLEDSTAMSAEFSADNSNECRGILFDIHQWIVEKTKTQNLSKMLGEPIVIDCRNKGHLFVSDTDVSGSSASNIFFNSTPNPKCQIVFHAFLQFISDI